MCIHTGMTDFIAISDVVLVGLGVSLGRGGTDYFKIENEVVK